MATVNFLCYDQGSLIQIDMHIGISNIFIIKEKPYLREFFNDLCPRKYSLFGDLVIR